MRPLTAFALCCMTIIFQCADAAAQGNNQGGGNQGGGNQGGGVPGGIMIDSDGVIRQARNAGVSGRARRRLLESLPETVQGGPLTESPMRCVSLRSLETECRRLIDAGQPLPEEIQSLAGLTRIDHLFFFSRNEPVGNKSSDDVILVGPAEPLLPAGNGRVLGAVSGRPVLNLDDLLVLLRQADNERAIGCSFDPEPDRLAASQAFLKQNQQQASVRAGVRMFEQMADVLGNWKVSVFGIPSDSRVAMGLVEADFMLKQLTLGRENPGVRGFRSQLMMLRPGDDIMSRWWFVARYDAIERDEDGRYYRFSGPRIQLKGQDEVVDSSGFRRDAAVSSKSSLAYAALFSEQMDQIASRVDALANLQNLVDLITVTALIRRTREEGLTSWEPQQFADASFLPVSRYPIPSEVPSMSNARTAGRGFLVGLVAGGVRVEPRQLMSQIRPVSDGTQPSIAENPDTDGRWWWDVAPAEQ